MFQKKGKIISDAVMSPIRRPITSKIPTVRAIGLNNDIELQSAFHAVPGTTKYPNHTRKYCNH